MNATRRAVSVLLLWNLALVVPAFAQSRTNVAVFNFQMKSQTPDWAWLEKGLADQITTHFAQGGKLNVIARDEMQTVAQKVRWTPELGIADPGSMRAIQQELKIEYLVTGLYTVEGEQIKITGQVVEVEGRKERARKEAVGPVKDVLEIQRKLSAELLGWFTQKPAAEILPQLPLWSRSIPATRAVYEGVDLYDQGRYGEAWLKFRQASKDDGDYLEAQYWVGKMYYFMDRYEHAREAFERFVYMDRLHPRMGDAIREYVNTYEKVDTPPQQLLELYANLSRRLGGTVMYSPDDRQPLPARVWLQVRSAQVLTGMGRLPEAVAAASGVLREYYARNGGGSLSAGVWDGWSHRTALAAAQTYNLLTGKVLMPEGVVNSRTTNVDPGIIRFTPERTDVTVVRKRADGVGRFFAEGKARYDAWHYVYTLLVPEGYVLKKLTLYPTVQGEDGKIYCWLNQYAHLDVPAEKHLPVAEARRSGLVISNIPRADIFELDFYMYPNDPLRDPKIYFSGCRAVAELEKVDAFGCIRVSCPNASSFQVNLDGRMARRRAGLIGLVPPGRHVMDFSYLEWGSVCAPYQMEVTVEANRTTDLQVFLPWDANKPLVGWTSGSVIAPGSVPDGPCMQAVEDPPCILAEKDAVRVFWSHEGDIWCARSLDGNTFLPAQRLPMPVSTGWIEQDPLCLRDESGRYLLAFRSDRDGQHRMRAYVCWSRDASNWSSPAAVTSRAVNKFDMIQDSRGRYLWADATEGKLTVMASRDAYRWEPLAQWPIPGDEKAVRLLDRGDGSYALFLVDEELRTATGGVGSFSSRVAYCYRSKDAANWSAAQEIRTFRGYGEMSVSAMQVGGRTLAAFFEDDQYAGYWPFMVWARENDQGTWDLSTGLDGLGSYYGFAAYHPRWGYMVCWRHPMEVLKTRAEAGPFLIRGPSVERFFQHPTTAPAGPASSVGGKSK
jgi:TolB-like protein